MSKTALITGAAGFIGSHLTRRLIKEGWQVVGLDNFCDFYDPQIKRRRAEQLAEAGPFTLIEGDIRDADTVDRAFAAHQPQLVVHIAAMAGVRPSIERPKYYTEVNLDGTVNVLNACVGHKAGKLLFASSSSVYGNNEKVPFAEDDPVEKPISPYAATKRAGELICHTYWHLYRLPIFCLRFFTVFGPSQRPDLAIAKFMRLMRDGKPIPMYGDGTMSRDFTYVDDIVEGIMAAAARCDRYGIYNLGGHSPVTVKQLIEAIERVSGTKANIDQQPEQPGDVRRTYADLTRSRQELGFEPRVSLEGGLARQWQAFIAGRDTA
jgi:UDP-glucuronate 4-epimerase